MLVDSDAAVLQGLRDLIDFRAARSRVPPLLDINTDQIEEPVERLNDPTDVVLIVQRVLA